MKTQPEAGQVWEDRGKSVTVESVADDGWAIVINERGHRIGVGPVYFGKARLLTCSATDAKGSSDD